MNNTSKINIEETKNILHYVMDNNLFIQEQGKVPVAINIIGAAGLGKTECVLQVAKERGINKENIVIKNLADLEEIGDLLGMPVVEYLMRKIIDDKVQKIWVKERAIPTYEKLGFSVTNDSRMGYSIPEWVHGKSGPGILYLDDYSRASQRFTQAVMSIILKQEYASWSLPKGWTVVLSSNPDSGDYIVTEQDPAQKS